MAQAGHVSSTSRRGFLTVVSGVAAAASMLPFPGAQAANDDPIFDAIKRFEASFLDELRICDVSAKLRRGDPGYAAADATTSVAMDSAQEAAIDLAGVVPTTMAGILSLLAYIDHLGLIRLTPVAQELGGNVMVGTPGRQR